MYDAGDAGRGVVTNRNSITCERSSVRGDGALESTVHLRRLSLSLLCDYDAYTFAAQARALREAIERGLLDSIPTASKDLVWAAMRDNYLSFLKRGDEILYCPSMSDAYGVFANAGDEEKRRDRSGASSSDSAMTMVDFCDSVRTSLSVIESWARRRDQSRSDER